MRIISTVPSLTELLSDLGLDEQLVGITKFCIHPEHIHRTKTRVGGTKDLDLGLIRSLKADLIIANKEENERSQIESLQEDHEVLVTDIYDLESALEAILNISERVGRAPEGTALVEKIQTRFEALIPGQNKKVLYLIWKGPYMSVGQDTFIHDMLSRCGFQSVTAHLSRYPQVQEGALEPELILLSSEPFPFKEKHFAEIQSAWPGAEIKLVDGEYFSWYGSRMLGSVGYFQSLIESED